ncbi:hypothetical protein BGZ65_005644 [Modicella reniformis]|uniref:Uncharacterized protein n=1 Tax=Modicella reniformis TaxID=1440133 RepID=A0A9P6JIJ2_9FUNG|nr:hypothetical protein BGZ65_005644 [Modicella reniformis]
MSDSNDLPILLLESPEDSNSNDRRLYFRSYATLSKAVFEGTKKRSGDAATIPRKTPSFKFIAKFEECQVGHYFIRWRVKLLEGFSIPNGLHFSVCVSYDAEPDTSGSYDVPLDFEELANLDRKHPRGPDLDMELEELLVIQPHEKHAQVKLLLTNIKNERTFEYFGLQVNFVEIRPFIADKKGKGKHKLNSLLNLAFE